MELAAPYSLSRRVPSATRPPLRGATSLETRASGRMHGSGGVAERLNATVLKTVWPVTPVTRVRIPPPPLGTVIAGGAGWLHAARRIAGALSGGSVKGLGLGRNLGVADGDEDRSALGGRSIVVRRGPC